MKPWIIIHILLQNIQIIPIQMKNVISHQQQEHHVLNYQDLKGNKNIVNTLKKLLLHKLPHPSRNIIMTVNIVN